MVYNSAMKSLSNAYGSLIRPIRYAEDALHLLDQRQLPHQSRYVVCTTARAVADAIQSMVVRGAPAIGVAAAYGVVLACQEARAQFRQAPTAASPWRLAVEEALTQLAHSRPTAVNLFWALARQRQVLENCADVQEACVRTLQAADDLLEEEMTANRRMGELGAALIAPGRAVLTHCNTGSLATPGVGTALGVIRTAWAQGRLTGVYADETRPWLQGSRLTAWELQQDGIPVQLLCEGAAASLLRSGRVGWVVVGADRIAANGDTANKIGTYGLAVLARQHGVSFMVVAPCSTIDHTLADGHQIPIEERPAQEILEWGGQAVAPVGVSAWNPAFDVTPAAWIDALVTERGVIHHPDAVALATLRAS